MKIICIKSTLQGAAHHEAAVVAEKHDARRQHIIGKVEIHPVGPRLQRHAGQLRGAWHQRAVPAASRQRYWLRPKHDARQLRQPAPVRDTVSNCSREVEASSGIVTMPHELIRQGMW